jgi:hypothetical protein
VQGFLTYIFYKLTPRSDVKTAPVLSCANGSRNVHKKNASIINLAFFLHAEFEAFLETTVLALISVMLVNWTIVISSTRVCQVLPDGPLEETFATLARLNAVMLTARLVTTYDAFGA